MKKIKLLLFTVSQKNIGPSKSLIETSAVLDRAKYEIIFCTIDNFVSEVIDNLLFENNIKSINLGLNKYLDFRTIIRLRKILRSERVDILQTRLIRADFYGRIAGKFSKVPLIVTNITNNFKKHYEDYHGILPKLAYELTNIFSDVIVVNSKCLFAELKHNKYFKNINIEYIPNGVNLNTYKYSEESRNYFRSKYYYTNDFFLIGSTGRVVKSKGFINFVRAAKKVKDVIPNVQFLIAGAKEDVNEINNEISRLNLESSFKLIGQYNNIPELLSALDLYVFTSYHEGMPNSVLEALACGLPIVAFDAPGVNELVEDRENGFLIADRCELELAKAVIKVLLDNELRNRMRKNARDYVLQNYGIQDISKKFDKLYEKYQWLIL